MRRIDHETVLHATGLLHVGLATNLALAVALAPLLVLLAMVPDPTLGWPALVLLAGALAAPAFAGVAAVFAAVAADGPTTVLRTFARAWAGGLRRTVPLGLAAGAVLVVVGVDAVALAGTDLGAATLPLLVVVGALAVAVAVLALVALAERPAARVREVLRAAVWLAVRRWPFTLLSLVALLALAAAVATRPALGLGLAASPLLYVVWANSRWTLRPVLGEVEAAR
ncbi:ferredoxin-NADPH reductase [Cellulomonas endophytica]|uniref:ferredoxin-NADPH reductase n=1 Tax=Cellulomonas endophytica TaxID=2494735 RepID=UPI0010132B12|nr:ferredoxin-NADPH reductase [Cellulomonas endophytica]